MPYKIFIIYEDNYGEERLTIAYRQQLNNYLQKHIVDKEIIDKINNAIKISLGLVEIE